MISESCFPEWEAEIWSLLDGELSEPDRLRLERHLESCHRCQGFVAEARTLQSGLEGFFGCQKSENPLPTGFQQRIIQSLPGMISIPWYRCLWLSIRRNISPPILFENLQSHRVVTAAVFLLVLVTLYSFWLEETQYSYRVKIIAHGDQVFLADLSDRIQCNNPNGQMYEFPDGSYLYAKPGVSFTVESYQNRGDDRWIQLEKGEIFLDVNPDIREGFTVSTPEASLKVVGTRFSVRTKNHRTNVEVAHGLVLVENLGKQRHRSCLLQTGKQITADSRGRLRDWGEVDSVKVSEIHMAFDSFSGVRFKESRDALFNVPK